MGDDLEPIPIFSPRTARVLWIIAAVVVGLSLALNLWGWARAGRGWTTLLGPLGVFLLVVSYPIMRSRARLYAVLQVMALGFMTAALILTLRQL